MINLKNKRLTEASAVDLTKSGSKGRGPDES